MRSCGVREVMLSAVVASLLACGGGGSKPAPVTPPGTTGWTVLVYMTADNNLEADGLKDILEMSTVGSGTNLRYVVQVDRAVGQYAGPLLNLGDWTSTKRLLVQKDSLQQVADLGEVNMGLTASLAEFVNWGITTYPGEHYMLVLWDHGGGWKGFGWDDSNALPSGEPDHLSLDRIVEGVKQGLAGTGVAKLDVIGFDACLMATLEVATNLAPYASYLLASEEVEPGHGWDWTAFKDGGGLGAVALGTKVIDGYYAQATAEHDVADVTLSMVDLAKVGAIQSAVSGVSTAYPTAVTVAPVLNQVAAGRRGAQEYAANPDPAQAYSLVDLVDLFGGMSGVTGAAAVQAAVTAAVVYERHGAGKAGSHGLSIYFPPDGPLPDGYVAIPGMGPWRTFLNVLYGGGAAQVAPAFNGPGSYPLPLTRTGGLTLSAVLATSPADVSNAFITYGVSASASDVYLLGDTPASLSGATVTGEWDWSVLHVKGATTWDYGYLSLEIVAATLFAANIPFHYVEAPGAQSDFALWRILFDGTGSVVADNVYLYSGGGVAELTPVAGSRLHTLVKHVPDVATWASEWVRADDGTAAGDGFDATQPLVPELVALDSGLPFAAILRAENAGGEGTWTWVTNVLIP